MIDLTNIRKRALMRAEHRGMKEMDIILGQFATENLVRMNIAEIEEFEEFMEINDQKSYQMILGNEAVPEEFKALVQAIRASIGLV